MRFLFLPRAFIISISLLSLFPSLLYAQPRISFDTEIIDFGKVAAGTSVQGRFTFTNTGDRTLLIRGLRPG